MLVRPPSGRLKDHSPARPMTEELNVDNPPEIITVGEVFELLSTGA
jgi:hypothetical protein